MLKKLTKKIFTYKKICVFLLTSANDLYVYMTQFNFKKKMFCGHKPNRALKLRNTNDNQANPTDDSFVSSITYCLHV